ncbi:MAG: hypothetical protein K0Q77_1964 [Anaerosporomusa subterranea]|jgi:hypothetical protein|nr:hypothetical protein [Anaerosporomusa subterranea]
MKYNHQKNNEDSQIVKEIHPLHSTVHFSGSPFGLAAGLYQQRLRPRLCLSTLTDLYDGTGNLITIAVGAATTVAARQRRGEGHPPREGMVGEIEDKAA